METTPIGIAERHIKAAPLTEKHHGGMFWGADVEKAVSYATEQLRQLSQRLYGINDPVAVRAITSPHNLGMTRETFVESIDEIIRNSFPILYKASL